MSEKKQLSSQTDSSDLSLGRCLGDLLITTYKVKFTFPKVFFHNNFTFPKVFWANTAILFL